MSSTLKVYSASAGSGKTFTLTGEFINMIVRNPERYANILAATFTQKATAEMKTRIIERLYIMSADDKLLTDKEKATRKQMLEICREATGLDKKTISKNCLAALICYLNDFSHFNISTIDSFTQKIIRGFAYEAGLPAQFEIELDQNLLIDEAVERIIGSVDDDHEMQEWILSSARNQMETDGKWNIEGRLKNFGSQIFNENSRRVCDSDETSPTRQQLRQYCKELEKIRVDYESEVDRYTREYTKLLDDNGITAEMFKSKTKNKLWTIAKTDAGRDSFLKFESVVKSLETLRALLDDEEKIIQPKAADVDRLKNALPQIIDLVSAYVEFVDRNVRNYFTAQMVEKRIYDAGILNDIRRQIDDIAQEKGQMLIADTTTLLNKIIDNNETPFIYEKTGTRFFNFMIDEFQDTSNVQWHNFKPLMLNSLSQDNDCLVVGDVKQSIYRWRSSDWRLLSNIANDIKPYSADVNVLKTNWRSCANIVRFNNAIFDTAAAEVFAEKIAAFAEPIKDKAKRDALSRQVVNIYDGCSQSVPTAKEKDEGYISLKFVDGSDGGDVALTQMIEAINKLNDEYGYKYKDICVLVRGRNDGNKVVASLLENKIPVISSGSLQVCSSVSVKLLISYIKFINNPSDETFLAHIMMMHLLPDNKLKFSEIWSDERGAYAARISNMKGLVFGEMLEAIIADMPEWIKKNQEIFIDAFVDAARNYANTQSVNLNEIIEWIDQKAQNLMISVPQTQDAVQVMTIHKSKGLEKKAVLIPFLGWRIEESNARKDILWVNIDESPFDIMKPTPMSYQKKLALTHADTQYIEELAMRHIDNLNLLYVALTRAEKVLMMWGETSRDFKKKLPVDVNNMSELMFCTLSRIGGKAEFAERIAECFDSENLTLEIGIIPSNEQVDVAVGETISLDAPKSCPFGSKLKINLASEHFSHIDSNQKAVMGKVMHRIMESIETQADIEASVSQAQIDGLISQDDVAEIVETLRRKISQPEIAEWFDGRYTTINERKIITKTDVFRPDRVMIGNGKTIVADYKFGEAHTAAHTTQVRKYMELLKLMGYSNIEGYIWYFNSDDKPVKV